MAFFFILGILLSILFFDLTATISVSEKMFASNDARMLKTELMLATPDTSNNLGFDSTSVTIDNIYTRMVLNAFVENAVNYGLDYDDVITHIRALDVIIVKDMSELNIIDTDSNKVDLLGLTLAKLDSDSSGRIRGAIFINIKLLDNLDLYAFTLYHELGHWFGLEHCGCDDRIMMDNHTDADVDLAFIKWDQSVRIFMKKINDRYDKENCHYDFPDFILQPE